ncbi:ESX secretion-associated protein EspG [Kibdelosporangium persicum]|uniref:ESX secretion-associated protein EspG n=1 Tax=Kibdelosporangium persicum TaxID=2698649 RepID=UPI0039F049F7
MDVDVVESLSVVCRAGVEYYGWIASHGTGRLGVLAAATGREAILAVRDRDEVWLRRAQPKKLAEALVAQLPEVHPGAGTPVSVPVDELRAAAAWQEQKPGAVSVQPVPRADLRQVLRVIALPTSGSGELWVAETARRRPRPAAALSRRSRPQADQPHASSPGLRTGRSLRATAAADLQRP